MNIYDLDALGTRDVQIDDRSRTDCEEFELNINGLGIRGVYCTVR